MSNTTIDVGMDIYNIIRDMFEHFDGMEPEELPAASTRLRAQLDAATDALQDCRRAALRPDDARDAEIYRRLDRLFLSPFRPRLSERARRKRDLWEGLSAVRRLLNDICWVAQYHGRGTKMLWEVLDEHLTLKLKLNDYGVPDPISRLLALEEGSQLSYRSDIARR